MEFRGVDYVVEGSVQGRSLEKGMKVSIYAESETQSFSEGYEILGFSGAAQKYGRGKVQFDSVKDVFKVNNVCSLNALEKLENESKNGRRTYVIVKNMKTNQQGPRLYLYKGCWVLGSECSKIDFYRLFLMLNGLKKERHT